MPSAQDVEAALSRLWLGGGAPRREDHKKIHEVSALLGVLERLRGPPRARRLLVDAAAGHAYVGILAALLGGWQRVRLIERSQARLARAAEAAERARELGAEITLAAEDVAAQAAWPEAPDCVVALHACGAATDSIIDRAVAARARWILVVPCCYGRDVPHLATFAARAAALGLPAQAEVRRRWLQSLVDAERVLRLEAAGWEVTAEPLVAPTVTPHNLLLRARHSGEPRRMQLAAQRREALLQPT